MSRHEGGKKHINYFWVEGDESVGSPGTVVTILYSTRRNIPKDSNLHTKFYRSHVGCVGGNVKWVKNWNEH
jgi:hypothetical protein